MHWGSFQSRWAAAAAVDPGPAGSEIEILSQWTGTESGYRERPSYFLVRSLPELQLFWEKHASDEPIPNVDFEKRMLFVWVSGPSLSGYHVLKAVRVVRSNQEYVLELDLRRSDTAGSGSWRNPWLMALLPKFRGDIEVVRRGNPAAGEAERMPLAVIHDMGAGQGGGAVITKVSSEGGAAKPEPAVSVPGGGSIPPVHASKPVEKTPVEKPVAATPVQPAAPSAGTGDEPSASQAPAATTTAETDPFGDAFNLDF